MAVHPRPRDRHPAGQRCHVLPGVERPLVPHSVDPLPKTPAFKSVLVSIEPEAETCRRRRRRPSRSLTERLAALVPCRLSSLNSATSSTSPPRPRRPAKRESPVRRPAVAASMATRQSRGSPAGEGAAASEGSVDPADRVRVERVPSAPTCSNCRADEPGGLGERKAAELDPHAAPWRRTNSREEPGRRLRRRQQDRRAVRPLREELIEEGPDVGMGMLPVVEKQDQFQARHVEPADPVRDGVPQRKRVGRKSAVEAENGVEPDQEAGGVEAGEVDRAPGGRCGECLRGASETAATFPLPGGPVRMPQDWRPSITKAHPGERFVMLPRWRKTSAELFRLERIRNRGLIGVRHRAVSGPQTASRTRHAAASGCRDRSVLRGRESQSRSRSGRATARRFSVAAAEMADVGPLEPGGRAMCRPAWKFAGSQRG